MNRSITLALIITIFALPAFAGEPNAAPHGVTATLTLPYTTVLPGVPFDMIVRLHNGSSRKVTVGLVASLLAKDANGTVLLRPWRVGESRETDRNRGVLEPHDHGYVVLEPGQSVERVIDWQRSIPGWHQSAAIAGPGTYEVSLQLQRGQDEFEDFVNYAGPIWTTTARLSRIAFAGDDQAIWQRMQETAGQRWADGELGQTKRGGAVAQEIVRMHPSSAYYPYALILPVRGKIPQPGDLTLLAEAAARFTDSPAHAHLLHRAGIVAMYFAQTKDGKEPTDAQRNYELAEQYFRAALASKNTAVRAATEWHLRRLQLARAPRQQ